MKQILCFGDSNTWGLIPGESNRYEWGIRWTSILQEKLNTDYQVLEEGLCGRTTIFEDAYRDNRNGLKTLPMILESHNPIEAVVIMLGTNDCKSFYSTNAYKISKGLEQCLEKILEFIPKEKVLVVSPIHLGDRVWEDGFDPEFDRESVKVSKELQNEYQKISQKNNVSFLAASDFASPSVKDQEHMDEKGHESLANAIYNKLAQIIEI